MVVLLGVLLPSPGYVAAEGGDSDTTTTTAPHGTTTGSAISADGTDTRRTNYGTPVDLDPALDRLIQDIGPTLSNRWAGAWVNPDGTVTVALTGEEAAPAVLATHPQVAIVTFSHSLERLTAAHKSAVDRLNALLAPGIEPGSKAISPWPYVSHTEVKDNIVDVLVDKKYKDKQEQIEAALADELAAGTIRITYGKAPTNTPACGTRVACAPPFRGGITNTRYATGTSCTLGFVMTDGRGMRYHSSAGHCWRPGGYHHAGRGIGDTTWQSDSGNVDGLIISQNNENEVAPTNWIYRWNNTDTAVTYRTGSPSYLLIGNYICLEAQASGSQCANLSRYDASWDGRCCFGEMNSYACQGDSGGPIVHNNTNEAYGLMLGIRTNIAGCGTPSVFTWIINVENASGYTTLLRPTTRSLAPGQRLNPGYALQSTNQSYTLIMQGDGNLVLYNWAGTALWSSNTWGNPGAFAVMQNDGNLVVYSAARTPLWNRPGGGWVANSWLTLQDDSNLVVYTWGGTWKWHRWCGC